MSMALQRRPRGQGLKLRRPARLQQLRASSDDKFDLTDYHEAVVGEVLGTDDNGGVVILRLKDDINSVLKVFIGRIEADSMRHALGDHKLPRPNTHDAMAELIDMLKCRVTKVCISDIRSMTYYARLYLTLGIGADVLGSREIVMDMRPSDAMSIALRLGSPIYVAKAVAQKMARPPGMAETVLRGDASRAQLVQSCLAEAVRFADPTTLYRLSLQLAVAEERFADAARLRAAVAATYASHPGARACVAMQAALADGRLEEALRHRDELRALRIREFQRSAVGAKDDDRAVDPSTITPDSWQD